MDANHSGSGAVAGDLQSSVLPQLQDASERLTRLNERAIDFIRERPGTCLIAAAALGFVVGKIAARL